MTSFNKVICVCKCMCVSVCVCVCVCSRAGWHIRQVLITILNHSKQVQTIKWVVQTLKTSVPTLMNNHCCMAECTKAECFSSLEGFYLELLCLFQHHFSSGLTIQSLPELYQRSSCDITSSSGWAPLILIVNSSLQPCFLPHLLLLLTGLPGLGPWS